MIYQFRSTDGELLEIERPMADAPGLMEKITRKGKTFQRVLSTSPPLVRKDCRIVSSSEPRWSPNHKGEFTKDGKPVYTSWKQVANYTSRASDSDHETTYDTWSGAKT